MLFLLENMETNPLRPFPICEISIEKSIIALELEKKYDLDWGFDVHHHIESFYYLRACIEEKVQLQPGEIKPIPTGIYPELHNPAFEIEVRNYSNLVYESNLCLAEGVCYFPYTYRNEIFLLIENKNSKAQYIHPAQKIALFSVKYQPQMVIKYVHQIGESLWKTGSGKSYIQKVKQEYKNYEKPAKISINYGRAEINDYTKDEK
jgi:dUTPase